MTSDEFENKKRDTKNALDEAGDKLEAGAKAVANKLGDTDKDIGKEYKKEKLKEDLE
ncbi:MAG TPA: hypothetical protein VFV86_03305 [Nitrososphaeraceae archaeon]|nr:hypothetical protein [Nitrososphaeraceae archaeon]